MRAALWLSLALLSGCMFQVDEDGDGFALLNDCDDEDPTVSPEAPELCDDIDNDCNGIVDDGAVDAVRWYTDNDGDGFGSTFTWACEAPDGLIETGGDCNDNIASINPAALEDCNGIDDNCNGQFDEGLAIVDYFFDEDGDGYGVGDPIPACAAPEGTADADGDCDDTLAQVNPGAIEQCNEADDDCDGLIDDGAEAVDWYADADGDGFGAGAATNDCIAPSPTHVTDNTDCDDAAAATNPGAAEVCDGNDNNCDGASDEGLPITSYYTDADGDGFGAAGPTTDLCDETAPAGTSATDDDCDDTNAEIFPGAVELCGDDEDNDCDGTEAGAVTFWPDAGGTVDYTADFASAARIDLTLEDPGELALCGGTYWTGLELLADVVVQAYTTDPTVLSGNDANRPIVVEESPAGVDPTVLLDGLIIQQGTTPGFGGAVLCQNAELLVNDVVFTNNDGRRGGAIYADNCELTIEASQFSNNTAIDSGGAIEFDNTFASLSTTVFAANSAPVGGAVFGTDITADGVTFDGNTASERGAAIRAIDIELVDATLINNTATLDSGALLYSDTADITNTTFGGNGVDIRHDSGNTYTYDATVDVFCNPGGICAEP